MHKETKIPFEKQYLSPAEMAAATEQKNTMSGKSDDILTDEKPPANISSTIILLIYLLDLHLPKNIDTINYVDLHYF